MPLAGSSAACGLASDGGQAGGCSDKRELRSRTYSELTAGTSHVPVAGLLCTLVNTPLAVPENRKLSPTCTS